jgi:hypothetical protein
MPKQHHCEACGSTWIGPTCRPCHVCGERYVLWTNAQEWLDDALARDYVSRTGHAPD